MPLTKKWGITRQTCAGWRGSWNLQPTEAAQGWTYPLLHAVIGAVCDLGDEGQRTYRKKQSRGLGLLGRAGLAATSSPLPTQDPCRALCMGGTNSSHGRVRSLAQSQLGHYRLSDLDSHVTTPCLSFLGCN